MQATVEKVILLPRFSSFVGNETFYTAPMNVRAYSEAEIAYKRVGTLGSNATSSSIYIEESPDLEIWEQIGSSLSSQVSENRQFRFEWVRLKLVLSGSDPGITCWCVANMVRRDGV